MCGVQHVVEYVPLLVWLGRSKHRRRCALHHSLRTCTPAQRCTLPLVSLDIYGSGHEDCGEALRYRQLDLIHPQQRNVALQHQGNVRRGGGAPRVVTGP